MWLTFTAAERRAAIVQHDNVSQPPFVHCTAIAPAGMTAPFSSAQLTASPIVPRTQPVSSRTLLEGGQDGDLLSPGGASPLLGRVPSVPLLPDLDSPTVASALSGVLLGDVIIPPSAALPHATPVPAAAAANDAVSDPFLASERVPVPDLASDATALNTGSDTTAAAGASGIVKQAFEPSPSPPPPDAVEYDPFQLESKVQPIKQPTSTHASPQPQQQSANVDNSKGGGESGARETQQPSASQALDGEWEVLDGGGDPGSCMTTGGALPSTIIATSTGGGSWSCRNCIQCC